MNYGVYKSIKDAWATYPNGGVEGAYIVVNGVRIYWSSDSNSWGSEEKEEIPTPDDSIMHNKGTFKDIITEFIIAEIAKIKGSLSSAIFDKEKGFLIDANGNAWFKSLYAEEINSSSIGGGGGVSGEYLSKIYEDTALAKITFAEGLISLALVSLKRGLNVEGDTSLQKVLATGIEADSGAFNILKAITAEISESLSVKNQTVSGKIASENYAESLLGWFIKQDGTAQLKGLKLLEFLDVPELRYNRVTVLAGESWRGPGAGLIESVDIENQIVSLKLVEGDSRTVELDDICKGIFHHNNGFQTVFFRVTELVGDTAFKYSLRPGINLHPSPMMNFISYGNFTNPDRQKSVQETTSYKRYLANVNTWDISPSMIMMQLGDLTGLKINGVAMDGYSSYLNKIFMVGTIKQLSSSGSEVNVAIIMGEWQTGSYGYYEQVTHNGSSWLCVNEKGTSSEPVQDSPDWLEISAKGKDAISVSVESSNGNIMLYGQWSTVLTCTVRSGDKDITDSIPQSRISWERTSADPSGDLAFNITHQGIGKQLEITKDDIFRKAKFDVVVNL